MEGSAIEYIIVKKALFLVVKYFEEDRKSDKDGIALKLRVSKITDLHELKDCEIIFDVTINTYESINEKEKDINMHTSNQLHLQINENIYFYQIDANDVKLIKANLLDPKSEL